MRVLGLISGGKDSIFAIHCVVASGHEVVALGHITPSRGEEPDSEMYQSVATEGINFVAQALECRITIESVLTCLKYTGADNYGYNPEAQLKLSFFDILFYILPIFHHFSKSRAGVPKLQVMLPTLMGIANSSP